MTGCKAYKIYKFDHGLYNRADNDKNRALKWQYAREKTDFKHNLIEKFSGMTFKEISEKHCIMSEFHAKHKRIQEPYKKDWLYGAFEIGMDMLEERYGIVVKTKWDRDYFCVPLYYPEVIAYFDEHAPKWVKIRKRV